MSNEELIARITELSADHRVVVVRVDSHEEKLKELADASRKVGHFIMASLFTAVVTLGTLVLSLLGAA